MQTYTRRSLGCYGGVCVVYSFLLPSPYLSSAFRGQMPDLFAGPIVESIYHPSNGFVRCITNYVAKDL